MHDPMVVAFEIRRPWPQRSTWHDAKPGKPRWQMRHHHVCGDYCGADRAKHEASNPFPWWRLGSYSVFWTLAGRCWYWPSLITIWHVEPGGHDSGEVCKHYERNQQPDGTWTSKTLRGWRCHVHHWRIQIHPFQTWRRRLLTRCDWCGGRSRKGDAVNVSQGGDRPKTRWWQGERGLLHVDCSAIQRAHRACLCVDPICGDTDSKGQPYGLCVRCGHRRPFQATAALLDRLRLLASIPTGRRDAIDMSQPTERPWLNRGSDPVSERVYSLIFNGLTGTLTDFMPLSERARVSEGIYESLRTGGVEVRLGDGLAQLREVAGRCGQTPPMWSCHAPRPVCALPAGHAGWHRADDGCEWGVAEVSQP